MALPVATPLERGPEANVSVLLPVLPLRAFDYSVPSGMDVAPGQFVRAPLGSRSVVGVVWGSGSADIPQDRVRPIITQLGLPPMPSELRELIDWVARYYVAPLGAVLRMAMSVPSAFDPPKSRKAYIDQGTRPERLTPQRARVFEVLSDGKARFAGDIAEAARVTLGVVRGLVNSGYLGVSPTNSISEDLNCNPDYVPPVLSELQRRAAAKLCDSIKADRFLVQLLDGVTGSGKTEVYFEAIAETLRVGRQALVLLPEIALSAQWLAHFESRFGVRPTVWHSELTTVRRRENWRRVSSGQASLVVGARSALFLPFARLGLIVVDEEHDTSYKQEDGVLYNARDVAVMRGSLSKSPVVLVSATPSLESHNNATLGRYRRISLPQRYGRAALPDIEVVDMRIAPPARGRWLSPTLETAIRSTLDRGEQAMLFLNRRGYAPLSLCRSCGFRLHCSNCTTWLVEHRLAGLMRCHHCGYSQSLPEHCPECKAEASLVACGPGVERVAEELVRIMPKVTLKVMTSDTVASVKNAESLVKEMLENRIDVLIGTQIVTKGYHFPNLTLVGVVDADLGLSGGDLRAAERSMQLLAQVSGRAGRAERPGKVMLQTYMSNHPVIQALSKGDRDGFLGAELAARDASKMPPFVRLAAIIISSPNEAAARDIAADIARVGPSGSAIEVFGPAPAPIYQQRGRFRYRLLIKAPRPDPLQDIIQNWLATVSWPGYVTVRVDIDPYSFM